MRRAIKFKTEILPSPVRGIVPDRQDPTALVAVTAHEVAFSRRLSTICIVETWIAGGVDAEVVFCCGWRRVQ